TALVEAPAAPAWPALRRGVDFRGATVQRALRVGADRRTNAGPPPFGILSTGASCGGTNGSVMVD
ncbi:hypothetical protein, partial [Agromyces sp. NPDC056965]|uniref:hypothetical protein n=1 Tax=Agromyces sp. NPDC056965 TaxID=3345983 RepID=UPI00363C9D8C